MSTRALPQRKTAFSQTRAPHQPVHGLVQRACACGAPAGLTGECEECRRERLLGRAGPLVQAKLTVGRPGDRCEQEADRVADQVLRMPAPRRPDDDDEKLESLGHGPAMQREADERDEEPAPALQVASLLQREAAPDEEREEQPAKFQASAEPGDVPQVTPELAGHIAALHGAGQPLPAAERAFMEPRFGRDFSQVRLHTGAGDAKLARAVQARAFTLGRHVVFGAGQFAPGSSAGRRLLAHELTHVVQQGASNAGAERVQRFTEATLPGASKEWQPGGAFYVAPASPSLWGRDAPGLPPVGSNVAIASYLGSDQVELSESVEFNKAQLKRFIAKRGSSAAITLVSSLERNREGVSANDAVAVERVRSAAKEALTLLQEESSQFTSAFEKLTTLTAFHMLDTSQAQIRGHIERLNLTHRVRTVPGGTWHGEELERGVDEYFMQEGTEHGAALQQAAKQLLAARRNVERTQARISALYSEPSALRNREGMYQSKRGDNGARKAQLDTELQNNSTEYERVRDAVVKDHPALGLYADLSESAAGLETIAAHGASRKTAETTGPQLFKILDNIRSVRKGLQKGKDEVNVWRLPNAVAQTAKFLGVQEGSYEQQLITEKVSAEAPGALWQLALAIVDVLGLLLAGPTGGLSLLASLAANTALLGMEVASHTEQSRLSGTATSSGNALVPEKPSLVGPVLAGLGFVTTAGGAMVHISASTRYLAALSVAAPELPLSSRLRLASMLSSHPELIAGANSLGDIETAAHLGIVLNASERKALQSLAKTNLSPSGPSAGTSLSEGASVGGKQSEGVVQPPNASHTQDFDALVKRRGSAAAELDHHPPGWMGKDEARFRYGEKAAKSEPGYRWTLGPNGKLHYERLDKSLPKRRFNPANGVFEDIPVDASALLESKEELAKLAYLGKGATSRIEWLDTIRNGIPELKGLSDDQITRILSHSPRLDHMRGALLEELASHPATIRAKTLGEDVEYISPDRIRDAAGAQLTDGMLLRKLSDGTHEIPAFVEAKAGEASARQLGAARKAFNKLSKSELDELRKGALEEYRIQHGLPVAKSTRAKDQVRLPNWAHSNNILEQHPDEIEALMRQIHTKDMGQFRKTFERLMPGADDNLVMIKITGKGEVHVRASPSRTVALSATPTNVPLPAEVGKLGEQGIRVQMLDVGLTSERLEAIGRQLRAEVVVNGQP